MFQQRRIFPLRLNDFNYVAINPSHPVREQTPEPLPDRKALDDIVFDILGPTPEEHNEVYWAVCEEDYFKLISFNPRIMEIFLSRPHFDYEEYSRETMGLNFPTGETLHVGINPSGQIQSWWGQVAKISKEYQELLARYSEPWKEKLDATHDYPYNDTYSIKSLIFLFLCEI